MLIPGRLLAGPGRLCKYLSYQLTAFRVDESPAARPLWGTPPSLLEPAREVVVGGGVRWTCLPRSKWCDSGGSLDLSEPQRGPGWCADAPCLPPSLQCPPLGVASCPPQRGWLWGPGPTAGRLERARPAQPCPALPSLGASSLPTAGCLPFSQLQVDPCPSDSSRMCEAVVWCPSGRGGVSGLGTSAQGRPRETLANEQAGLQGGRAVSRLRNVGFGDEPQLGGWGGPWVGRPDPQV